MKFINLRTFDASQVGNAKRALPLWRERSWNHFHWSRTFRRLEVVTFVRRTTFEGLVSLPAIRWLPGLYPQDGSKWSSRSRWWVSYMSKAQSCGSSRTCRDFNGFYIQDVQCRHSRKGAASDGWVEKKIHLNPSPHFSPQLCWLFS